MANTSFQCQPYDNVTVAIAWNYADSRWQYHVKVKGLPVKIFSDVKRAQRYTDSHGRGFRDVPDLAQATKKLKKP